MNKLDTPKASLEKKQAKFSKKPNECFSGVKSANGQPLNDKRNGYPTMRRWDRQNDTLSKTQKETEGTQTATEREEGRMGCIDRNKNLMSEEIRELINDGILKQWGKYPHIMFVESVDKTRIIQSDRKKVMMHRFVDSIANIEQRKKFARAYNSLNASINEGTGEQGKKQQGDTIERQELENSKEFKAIKELEHALNDYGWNEERFASVVTTFHRILQQTLFGSTVEVIRIMGSREYGYDLRNKALHEICKRIVESEVLENKGIPLI